MKRILAFCLILLLPIWSPATALDAIFDESKIQCPNDFFLTNAARSTTGTLVLAGAVGEPMRRIPLLMCVDPDGNVNWTLQGDNYNSSNIYRDVKYINDDTLIALRSADGYNDGWVVEFIENGDVIWEKELTGNVFGILPLTDGILVPCGSPRSSASVVKIDLSGEFLWQFELDESIVLHGLASQNSIHIAYGYRTLPGDDGQHGDPTSVVFALDDQGNLLWRHDSVTSEEFIDAVWTDQDHIVLAGDAKSDDLNDGREYAFIAEYDKNGPVWRTNYYYSNGGSLTEGDVESIIPTQSGYVVVTQLFSVSSSVRLLYYGWNGNLLNEWDIPFGNVLIQKIIPFHKKNDNITLLIGGKEKPKAPDDGLLIYLLTSTIVLKEIHLHE